MTGFPDVSDSAAREKLLDVVRLADDSLTDSDFIDGSAASRLLGTSLGSFRDLVRSGSRPDFLSARSDSPGQSLGLAMASVFDLIVNAEYIHGRLVNSRWIYCHRDGETPRAYYSFLKQCPRCCLDKGLEPRLGGAQHKPTSHHIGEITTVATALLLQFLTAANRIPFHVATITKQSHDVDAFGYSDNLIVLFEIKASPMATYPIVVELEEPMMSDSSGEPEEYSQHSLVDMKLTDAEFFLYIPHRDLKIPLGGRSSDSWPYDELRAWFSSPANFGSFLSAWLELYDAYRVPKTLRTTREMRLSYLVNGWGDEIDSNKTKPGLGRTDDIKKGTYQLMKFGAYYRDDGARAKVRGALIANLDPLFLRSAYLDKLVDVRWGRSEDFVEVGEEFHIRRSLLRHLYDAILTFNAPIVNDEALVSLFNFSSAAQALSAGKLDHFLSKWSATGPEAVVGKPLLRA